MTTSGVLVNEVVQTLMEESFGGVNTEVSRLYQCPLKLDFLCRFAFLFSLNFRPIKCREIFRSQFLVKLIVSIFYHLICYHQLPGLLLKARGPVFLTGFVSGFKNASDESFVSSSTSISHCLSSDSISPPSGQLSFPFSSGAGSLVMKLLIVSERLIFDEYSPSFTYSERGFNV